LPAFQDYCNKKYQGNFQNNVDNIFTFKSNRNYSLTLLIAAVASKAYNITSFILKFKPDVNKPDSDGNIPVLIAVQNQDLNILQIMLQHQASLLLKNHFGRSALYYVENSIEDMDTKLKAYLLIQQYTKISTKVFAQIRIEMLRFSQVSVKRSETYYPTDINIQSTCLLSSYNHIQDYTKQIKSEYPTLHYPLLELSQCMQKQKSYNEFIRCLNNLATQFVSLKLYKEAIDCYKYCFNLTLKFYKQFSDKQIGLKSSELLEKIADCYVYMEDIIYAKEYLTSAISIHYLFSSQGKESKQIKLQQLLSKPMSAKSIDVMYERITTGCTKLVMQQFKPTLCEAQANLLTVEQSIFSTKDSKEKSENHDHQTFTSKI